MLAALTWVQINIGTFGGDKDKVRHFRLRLNVYKGNGSLY